MTKPNWHGVYPAATTHFKPDYSHDLPAFQTHLDSMVKAGVHGLISGGSTGENYAETVDERLEIARFIVQQANRNLVHGFPRRLAWRFLL